MIRKARKKDVAMRVVVNISKLIVVVRCFLRKVSTKDKRTTIPLMSKVIFTI